MAWACKLTCHGQILWKLKGGSSFVGLGKDSGHIASLDSIYVVTLRNFNIVFHDPSK